MNSLPWGVPWFLFSRKAVFTSPVFRQQVTLATLVRAAPRACLCAVVWPWSAFFAGILSSFVFRKFSLTVRRIQNRCLVLLLAPRRLSHPEMDASPLFSSLDTTSIPRSSFPRACFLSCFPFNRRMRPARSFF